LKFPSQTFKEPMVTIDWKPSERQLRQFGWIGLVGFPLIGWTISRKVPESAAPIIWMIFGALGLICGLLALVSPKTLKPLYLLMMCIAAVVGPVVALVTLGLLFFLVFTPLALIFRLRRRDVLHRRCDPQRESYWISSDPPGKPAGYFRQF